MEDKVCEWVVVDSVIFIICGLVMNKKFLVIGKSWVIVLLKFFKVIFFFYGFIFKVIGFIFKNECVIVFL